MHPGTRRRWMTDQDFSFIRHIIFTFKIPTRRFSSLMQCFSVLLLGKTIQLDNFTDRGSLNLRLLRLSIFEWHRTASRFSDYISRQTNHGFIRYWYSITDNSKHLKVDRHAVIMSVNEDNSVPPSFKGLSISSLSLKDSRGNSMMNAELFKLRK